MRTHVLFISVLCAFSSIFLLSQASAKTINEINQIKVSSPSFLNVINSTVPSSVAVSSFKVNLMRKNAYHIGLLSDANKTFNEDIIDTDIIWPNEITYLPQKVFGQEGLLVASGFFDVIPLKHNSTGAVSFVDNTTHTSHKLTEDKTGFYYHKAIWVDLYGNGHYGVLTARTNSSPLKRKESELVYLTPSKNDPTSFPWNEKVIYSGGADTAFIVSDMDLDSIQEIYAAEYFNKALSVTFYRNGKWNRRVIDNSIDHAFNLEIADLNNSGQPSLLVTNHTKDEKNAGVYAYQLSNDIESGQFTKHVLATGFKTIKGGFGQAAPGKATPFFLSKNRKQKPSILVDGDGAETVTLLTPNSQDINDWSYSKSLIFKSSKNSIIGQSAIINAHANYPTKIFTPEYGNNKVHVFEVKN
ncbi:hypothetical protein SOPP22_12845 [Shewanella sp. OPT22]|nr:hypothetical protein SOPP22_12845 [Shewanella sp. OPT22]